MAGIGFELRKLFKGSSYLDNLKAYFVSSLVTIGPMMLCIALTTVLQFLLIYTGAGYSRRELFLSVTIYSFVFSLIVSSTMIMLISRYIADKAFLNSYDKIMSSLNGVLAITLTLGGILGIVFYAMSPMEFHLKLTAYIFYMELNVIWIQAVYVSLYKDYFKILWGFLSGVATSIALSCGLLFWTDMDPVFALLLSIDIGFFVIVASYMLFFLKLLPEEDQNIFSFIAYFDKYPSLIFICFFYNFGMYSHNFVFWLSNFNVLVKGTFYFSPIYDVPMFYAYFTITPTLVLFVVSVETSFFNKYKKYYQSILQGGNYQEILTARKEMISVLAQEISYIMEIQLIFSIVSLIIGRKYLPLVGLTGLSIDIFSILVLGCYVFVIMFVVILLLLYFDDRRGALAVTAFFLPCNTVLTVITLYLGERYFGVGFFVSGLLALILALARLTYYVKNIDYYTFCSQPIVFKEKKGIFTWLASKLER